MQQKQYKVISKNGGEFKTPYFYQAKIITMLEKGTKMYKYVNGNWEEYPCDNKIQDSFF